MAIEMVSPSKAAMVRLMPSTATDPFCTIQERTFSGTRTLSVQSVVCRSKLGLVSGDHGVERGHDATSVHMALDDVAAERTAGRRGQFQIDTRAGLERSQRGAVERFPREIGVEVSGVGVQRRQANAGDAQGIAFAEVRGNSRGLDGDAPHAASINQADQRAGLLDDAGEHRSSVSEQSSVIGS